MKILFFLVLILAQHASLAADKINVITSIRPIYSIFKNISRQEINLDYLVKNAGATHDFYLRPSDAGKLKKAELILIIDREFEPEIWSAITRLGLQSKTIELSHIEDLHLLTSREIFSREGEEHSDHNHSHHHGHHDYHIWLDVMNAQQIAKLYKEVISLKMPHLSGDFDSNYKGFVSKIEDLKKFLANQIAQVVELSPSQNFMFYHDGYQYFEKSMEKYSLALRDKGTITYGHHQLPGIKQTRDLLKYIKDNNVKCILLDPGYNQKFISRISAEAGIKQVKIDGEIGSDKVKEEDVYFMMMKSIASSFAACLE